MRRLSGARQRLSSPCSSASVFAFLAGAIASLIFSFLTITLRANQNVTGLALSIFGTGVGQFIGEYMRVSESGYVAVSNDAQGLLPELPLPARALQDIPVVGRHPLRPQLLLLPAPLRCAVVHVLVT